MEGMCGEGGIQGDPEVWGLSKWRGMVGAGQGAEGAGSRGPGCTASPPREPEPPHEASPGSAPKPGGGSQWRRWSRQGGPEALATTTNGRIDTTLCSQEIPARGGAAVSPVNRWTETEPGPTRIPSPSTTAHESFLETRLRASGDIRVGHGSLPSPPHPLQQLMSGVRAGGHSGASHPLRGRAHPPLAASLVCVCVGGLRSSLALSLPPTREPAGPEALVRDRFPAPSKRGTLAPSHRSRTQVTRSFWKGQRAFLQAGGDSGCCPWRPWETPHASSMPPSPPEASGNAATSSGRATWAGGCSHFATQLGPRISRRAGRSRHKGVVFAVTRGRVRIAPPSCLRGPRGDPHGHRAPEEGWHNPSPSRRR